MPEDIKEKQPTRWPQVLLTGALIGIAGGAILGKFDKAEHERKAMAREILALQADNRHLRSDVAILKFLQSQDESQLANIVSSLKEVYAAQQNDSAQFAAIAEKLARIDDNQGINNKNFSVIVDALNTIQDNQTSQGDRLFDLEYKQNILMEAEAWRLFQDWMWQQEQERKYREDKEKRPWAYPPYEHEAGYTVLPPTGGDTPRLDAAAAPRPSAKTTRNPPEHSL